MRRKPNTQEQVPVSTETNQLDTNELYRKRLRSWKQRPPQLQSNQIINDEVTPLQRSTMYTYPIKLTNDHQSIMSTTVRSQSSINESVFYCPSISYTSMQTTGDLNNNHVTTLNMENKKRKNYAISYESLSSQLPGTKIPEAGSLMDELNNISTKRSSMSNLQLTCELIGKILKL